MLNKDCEMFGGGYCLCDACQNMRKMLEELENLKSEDMMDSDEVKRVYEEMKVALEEMEK